MAKPKLNPIQRALAQADDIIAANKAASVRAREKAIRPQKSRDSGNTI